MKLGATSAAGLEVDENYYVQLRNVGQEKAS